jgi:dihydrofolate reductase
MISLDGYFADPDGQLDWFTVSDELEDYLREVHQEVGGYLYGRRTYQGMEAFWRSTDHWIADFLRSVPKFVASRSLEQVDWENSHLVRDLPGEVEKLKQEPGKAIFVAGSANLVTTLTRYGLVDEYRVWINPILLGAGTPLFQGGTDRLPLRLVDTRQLDSGLLILRYRPKD